MLRNPSTSLSVVAPFSTPCVKDGFFPTPSLPLGEIRVREQDVERTFSTSC
jgi:hypothetical protein